MVHPPGGIVVCYQALAQRLGRDRPFHAIRARGLHDESEPLPGRLEEMAADYVAALREKQPSGPYYLGGWSVGGLIAFEMARQLAREGETPELVALIDTVPPSLISGPVPSEDELAAAFARDLARLLGQEVALSPEDLRSPQTGPLFAMFANNLRASRAYAPETYPGRLALWLSEETLATIGPGLPAAWSRLAQGIETSTLPGDHYGLFRAPNVERLAREIAERLEEIKIRRD
jgi:thioesterase domain-containing protein